MWGPSGRARRDEVPIGRVTNGVHPGTWVAPELARASSARPPACESCARRSSSEELWRRTWTAKRRCSTHVAARRRERRRLDPDALTIGFARRFATYKRADLLFRDPSAALLADPERPCRSSSPARRTRRRGRQGRDPAGRRDSRAARVARAGSSSSRTTTSRSRGLLVQGVDVWLNTPRRPLEASGTSGMKAA